MNDLRVFFVFLVSCSSPNAFKVAVYEHRPVIIRRGTPLDVMMANVGVFEEVTRQAAAQHVDLLVFPEYGPYAIATYNSRDTLLPFLQKIPPPSFRPCESDPTALEIYSRFSCMSKTYNVTIIANMGAVVFCNQSGLANCPPDGRFQYNTNFAFEGGSGRLLAHYHKRNLFGEKNFDQGPARKVTFSSPIGKIGLGICFDLLFEEPLISMMNEEPVSLVVLPSLWFNRIPFLAMYEIAEAWAVRMRTHLLVANIHLPSNALTGSGIFGPNGVLNYTYVADPRSGGQLVTYDMPATAPRQSGPRRVHEFQKIVESDTFRTKTNGDMFKFAALKSGVSESVTICESATCCHLSYATDSDWELPGFFALGVFTGLHTENYTLYNEVCAVVRCLNRRHCGDGISKSAPFFRTLDLSASTTRRTTWFPTVLADDARLMQPGQCSFREPASLSLEDPDAAVLVFSLYGRVY